MERRRAPRNPEIRAAEVVFEDTALRCVAYSLSQTGARVHLLSHSIIPETVTLRLPNGTHRAARRIWQRADEAGFEYLSAQG